MRKYIKKINDDYSDVLMVALSIVLVIISGLGVWYVKFELAELRKQNSYLETTIKRASMPILCVREMHGKPSLVYTMIKEDIPGFPDLIIEINVENRGQGPLLLIGHVQYSSDSLFDFRSEFLSSKIDSSELFFDAIYTVHRGLSMFQGDSTKLSLIYGDIDEIKKRYFYTIIFYKDILGNLYDTVATIYMLFRSTDGIVNKEPLTVRNEKYHEYDREEQSLLWKYLKDVHPGLAEAVRL